MANVEFDESRGDDVTIYETRSGGLNKLVQKIGLAKSEKGANIVLMVIAIVCFLAAIIVYLHFFTSALDFNTPTSTNPRVVVPYQLTP